MALILLIWPSTGLVVQEVVIAARTASMSRAMPLAKLLSSLLPRLCDPFIELGDVATTEKGHKPLRQLGRRGEFRSLRK